MLRAFEMEGGSPEEHDVFDAPLDGPVKRAVHPYSDTAGIVRYRVTEGERVRRSQPIADIVAPTGSRERTIATEYDGYVLSRHEGAAVYENDPIADLAVPDETPLVTPYK